MARSVNSATVAGVLSYQPGSMPSFKHLDDRGAAILSWRCYICFSNVAGEEAATNFVEGIPDGGVLLSSSFSHGRLKALSDCLGGPTMLRTHHRSGYAPSASTSPYLCGCAHGRGVSIYDILGAGSSGNDGIFLASSASPPRPRSVGAGSTASRTRSATTCACSGRWSLASCQVGFLIDDGDLDSEN